MAEMIPIEPDAVSTVAGNADLLIFTHSFCPMSVFSLSGFI